MMERVACKAGPSAKQLFSTRTNQLPAYYILYSFEVKILNEKQTAEPQKW
jgi:hypothetical protein